MPTGAMIEVDDVYIFVYVNGFLTHLDKAQLLSHFFV